VCASSTWLWVWSQCLGLCHGLAVERHAPQETKTDRNEHYMHPSHLVRVTDDDDCFIFGCYDSPITCTALFLDSSVPNRWPLYASPGWHSVVVESAGTVF